MGAFQAKDAYDPYSAIASANANANEQPMPATEAPVNGTGTVRLFVFHRMKHNSNLKNRRIKLSFDLPYRKKI